MWLGVAENSKPAFLALSWMRNPSDAVNPDMQQISHHKASNIKLFRQIPKFMIKHFTQSTTISKTIIAGGHPR